MPKPDRGSNICVRCGGSGHIGDPRKTCSKCDGKGWYSYIIQHDPKVRP